MDTYNDILGNTLETMAADAEDKGRDRYGLTRLEPTAEEDHSKILPIYSPLAETVEGMLHPDYKERFKAEYQQTKIRYEKLKAFNNKIEAARRTTCDPFVSPAKRVDEPKHDCPEEMLRNQQSIMGQYLHILEVRAVVEGIEL